MNYAATLAVAVMLAFCFPLSVRLAAFLGIPEGLGATVLGAIIIFALTVYLVRWQVGRHARTLERLEQARAQIAAEPESPRSYFVDGEHLGNILLRLDRRREAAEVIDRYARLGGAREGEIIALREALKSAESRHRGAAQEV